MAVEIKEIVIRAIVSGTAQNGAENNEGYYSKGSNDALVQECVDQVLKVLKKKNRR